MKIRLKAFGARRLSEKVAPSTNWPLEVWVIHERGDAFASVAQVELFRDKGEWFAWTAGTVSQETKALAHELAKKRNAVARKAA